MVFDEKNPLVYTISDLCKICYTCVRECPAKAIKIEKGQAHVLVERCIGCGNCVGVCSQGAKVYYNSVDEVFSLLASGGQVIACVAPSFPAEFGDISDYRVFVGMVRELGFDRVVEVGFGADLVAAKYRDLYEKADTGFINSDCPAVVYYVRQYLPEIVDRLAPIDSPAMALAKVLKTKYGQDVRLVFVGPCIAKKAESDLYDAVLTFAELRQMFEKKGISPGEVKRTEFDPPRAGLGAIFPISSGLSQTVGRGTDIKQKIIIASGRHDFKEALNEFAAGRLNGYHLELLACDGCIAGPGITNEDNIFLRRLRVENYVRQKLENFDYKEWEREFDRYSKLDFSRTFYPQDRRLPMPGEQEIEQVLRRMGKMTEKDYLDCGACGYDTCRDHAIAVAQGLAEEEMCLPYTIDRLHRTIEELKQTQEALVQSEKLASMGQLSAGIAHELNNPLGVITLYANILQEEVDKDSPIVDDLKIIVDQAERCKKIVSGLLNFARRQQVNLKKTDICEFVKKAIASVVIPREIDIDYQCGMREKYVFIDQDQMMQALTNLIKNAVEAMDGKGCLGLEVKEQENGQVQIAISDTGCGIPKENLDKIFTPFFTTKKETGTGLGLPLVYGIIKMHKGKIFVKSNADPQKGPTGTVFTIILPRNPHKI